MYDSCCIFKINMLWKEMMVYNKHVVFAVVPGTALY